MMITYDDDSGRCPWECYKGWLPIDGELDATLDYEGCVETLLLFPVLEETACPCSEAWVRNDDLMGVSV